MIFWQSLLLILIVFHIAFVIGTILGNNAVVDPFWGLGFVAVAWFTILQAEVLSLHHVVVTLLITIWGLRLAWHLIRRLRKRARDWRYEEMKQQWNASLFVVQSYFKIYLLQAMLMFVISLPIIYINSNEINMAGFYLLSLGFITWTLGFFFESVGDKELRAFMAKPRNKGKIMDQGLWKYSRHPNYFGEATMWWAIWIISLSSQPTNFWLIISPITITYLLVNVSGKKLLEKRMLKNPDYKEYAKRTSSFIPRKPLS